VTRTGLPMRSEMARSIAVCGTVILCVPFTADKQHGFAAAFQVFAVPARNSKLGASRKTKFQTRAPGCARRWWGGKSQNTESLESQNRRIPESHQRGQRTACQSSEYQSDQRSNRRGMTRKAKPHYSNKTRKP
jgi:hypothetical protein